MTMDRFEKQANAIIDYAFGVYARSRPEDRNDDRDFLQIAVKVVAEALRKTRNQALEDAARALGGRYGAAAAKDIRALREGE